MPRNASGTFTLVTGNPVVAGTTIESTWANTTLSDIATELTNSLSRTGQGGMTAAFRLADGTLAAPGMAFLNETGTGLYRAGSGEMWSAVQGAQIQQYTINGVLIPTGKTFTAQGDSTLANVSYTGTLTGGTGVVNLGSGQFYKDASGSLGLGTASPTAKLNVVSAAQSVVKVKGGAAAGQSAAFYVEKAGSTATLAAFGDSAAILGGTVDQAVTIYADSSIPITFNQSSTERMRIDASGHLGLGKTPAYRLDIYAALEDGTPTVSLFNANASQRQGYFAHNLGNLVIGNARTDSTYGQIIFAPRSTEAARIDSSGNLLVGTTAAIASDVKLNVKNTTSATATVGFWNASTAGDSVFVGFGTEATYTSRGSIDYNRAGGLVRYNTTSDYRAKDILGPVANPGATIDALKVYEGQMKGATQSRPMLVAHEAQEHAPYAVSGVKDEVNEDGTPKFQQMDVSSLVPLLLAEIQSLRARVAALEA